MPPPNAALAELQNLIDRFGNQTKVAELLAVDKSAPTRWLTKGDKPGPVNEERIAALRLIALRLANLYAPQTAIKWLEGTNAYLGYRRPVDLIRKGRIAEVLAAIEQTATGAYA